MINIGAKERPINAENALRQFLAVWADIELILKLKYKTKPIGASITIHLKGELKIAFIKAGEFDTNKAVRALIIRATNMLLYTEIMYFLRPSSNVVVDD